jgi:hypothetical protein
MAIRLKYDAAAVVIPEDKAQQQFGQQLVQQQLKYANDQRQDIRSQLYDQQRQGVQNAAQAEQLKIRGQQILDGQKAQLAAQQARIQQGQENTRMEKAAIDRVRNRNATQIAVNKGEFGANGQAVMENLRKETTINRELANRNITPEQAEEAHAKNIAERDALLLTRMPSPTPAEVNNENILHANPITGVAYKPDAKQMQDGPPKGWVIRNAQTGKDTAPPEPPKVPLKPAASYAELVSRDPERAADALSKKMQSMKDSAADTDNPYTNQAKLRADAYNELKDDYEHGLRESAAAATAETAAALGAAAGLPPQKPAAAPTSTAEVVAALGSAMQPAGPQTMPVQGGTPAMQQPQAGVPAAAGQSTLPGQSAMQLAQKPWIAYSERAIGEEFVDLDGSIIVKTPSGPSYKGKVPPGTPLPVEAGVAPPNQFVSQAARDVAAADAATSDSAPPPLPNEQAVLDTLFPQGTPPDVATVPAVQPQVAQQQAPVQSQAPAPAMDMIGEALKTFESGTPEQKVALRDKFSDKQMLSSLDQQASAGNADAEKALEFLGSSLTASEVVADKVRIAKKDPASAYQMVDELKKMKLAGKLDDASYVSAIVENSGKSAKQVYENVLRDTSKTYGHLPPAEAQKKAEMATLNALWDEMGMFSSNPVTRAFQASPTMDDVVKHVVMKGKMPRKDAEEWVYNQILTRGYAETVQKQFEDQLGGDSDVRQDAKQDKKRDAWTPK